MAGKTRELRHQADVLSERHPRLRMVLDHLSHPPLGRDDWEPWRTLLRAAAANPLVHGLFGPGRLMFGSDWPVAELAGGYERVWTAMSRLLAEFTAPDRDAILGGTARAFYRLDGA